jgi:hypothetical protein
MSFRWERDTRFDDMVRTAHAKFLAGDSELDVDVNSGRWRCYDIPDDPDEIPKDYVPAAMATIEGSDEAGYAARIHPLIPQDEEENSYGREVGEFPTFKEATKQTEVMLKFDGEQQEWWQDHAV